MPQLADQRRRGGDGRRAVGLEGVGEGATLGQHPHPRPGPVVTVRDVRPAVADPRPPLREVAVAEVVTDQAAQELEPVRARVAGRGRRQGGVHRPFRGARAAQQHVRQVVQCGSGSSRRPVPRQAQRLAGHGPRLGEEPAGQQARLDEAQAGAHRGLPVAAAVGVRDRRAHQLLDVLGPRLLDRLCVRQRPGPPVRGNVAGVPGVHGVQSLELVGDPILGDGVVATVKGA